MKNLCMFAAALVLAVILDLAFQAMRQANVPGDTMLVVLAAIVVVAFAVIALIVQQIERRAAYSRRRE